MIKPTESPHWHRSRRCSTGACVEVAQVAERVLVRDSKVSDGAILAFTRKEWDSFLAGIKDGGFRSA